jgi:hypothetical protein
MDYPPQIIQIHARLQADFPIHAAALLEAAEPYRAALSDCMHCMHMRVAAFPLATTPPSVAIDEPTCAVGMPAAVFPKGALFHYCSSRLDPAATEAAASDWRGLAAAHGAEAERPRQQQPLASATTRVNPWVPRG